MDADIKSSRVLHCDESPMHETPAPAKRDRIPTDMTSYHKSVWKKIKSSAFIHC